MTFGEKVKNLRNEKDITQDQLAKKIGVSRRTVVNYEDGTRYPRDREKYHKLADYLGVSVNYLLTEDEEFIDEAGSRYGSRGQLQAAELLEQTRGLLAGGDLSEDEKAAFSIDLQKLFFKASDIASEKFNPTKNKDKL